jgi:hypothetical protein
MGYGGHACRNMEVTDRAFTRSVAISMRNPRTPDELGGLHLRSTVLALAGTKISSPKMGSVVEGEGQR